MSAPDYNELRSQIRQVKRLPRGRGSTLDPEVRIARRREQSRRTALAQSRALAALSQLHRDDYVHLYEQAKIEVAAEYGSLPGDIEETQISED